MWSTKDRLVGDELFCLTCERQNQQFGSDQPHNTAERDGLVGQNSRLCPEWSGNVSSVATGSLGGDLGLDWTHFLPGTEG